MAKSKSKSRREAKKRAQSRTGGSTLVGRAADGTIKPRTGVICNSGSGFHESAKYGKRERRQASKQVREEV